MVRRNTLQDGLLTRGGSLHDGDGLLHCAMCSLVLVSRYREIEHIMDHRRVNLGMLAMRKTVCNMFTVPCIGVKVSLITLHLRLHFTCAISIVFSGNRTVHHEACENQQKLCAGTCTCRREAIFWEPRMYNTMRHGRCRPKKDVK